MVLKIDQMKRNAMKFHTLILLLNCMLLAGVLTSNAQNTQTPKVEKVVIKDGKMRSTQRTPLILIDGKKCDDKSALENINPDDIESISVFKGEKATNIYGEEAADGAVIVSMKKNGPINLSQTKELRKGEPLYVIDGMIEYDPERIKTLDPDMIKEISVLKGEQSKQKYGKKGENGVMIITTKR